MRKWTLFLGGMVYLLIGGNSPSQELSERRFAFHSVYGNYVPQDYAGHQLYIPPHNRDGWGIPRAENVASILADVYDNPFNPEPIYNIAIPVNLHAELLRRFDDITVDSRPDLEMQEIGHLRIGHKSGAITRIAWYASIPATQLCFSFQGVRCFRRQPPNEELKQDWLELDNFIRKLALSEGTAKEKALGRQHGPKSGYDSRRKRPPCRN